MGRKFGVHNCFFSLMNQGLLSVPSQILAVNCHSNKSHSSISKRSSFGHIWEIHFHLTFVCHVIKTVVENESQNVAISSQHQYAQRQPKQGNNSPVTFANSSTICSFVLLLGMEPTNSLLLATEMHTPMGLPGRISLLLHCRSEDKRGRSENEEVKVVTT